MFGIDVVVVSNQWVASSSGNSTLVALVSRHLDVTIQSPLLGPGVLDQPVILVSFRTVADNQNAVIKLICVAILFIVNAVGVKLEGFVAGINGDRDWTDSGNGILKGNFISRLDIDKSLVIGSNSLGVELALFFVSLVGVRFLSINATIGLDILEGKVHESTFASVVAESGRTIHKVLLAEGNQLSGLAEMLTLQRSSGRESPAGSALSLVLDGSHGSVFSPIDFSGGLGIGRRHVSDGFSILSTGFLTILVVISVHDTNELMVKL